MIIGLSGYAGSGKDTVGKIIQWQKTRSDIALSSFELLSKQEQSYNWQIKKFAGPLRKVAAILLGMDEEFLYTNEFKQMVLPQPWNKLKVVYENDEHRNDGHSVLPMTGREFLQLLGTDAIRDGLHPNAWVNALMSEYRCLDYQKRVSIGNVLDYSACKFPNWIITDMRFPNEMAAIKDRGGITIRVNRGKAINLHPSETALDNAQFDFVIDNNGTIDDLINNVRTILNQLEYGKSTKAGTQQNGSSSTGN